MERTLGAAVDHDDIGSGTLPSGTVTFLMTDLEGSTALWERDRDAMRAAVERHEEVLTSAVIDHGGHIVKTTGDGIVAAFANASDAIAAAIAGQEQLAAEAFTLPIAARMGICTGEAEARGSDYHAPVLNRTARIMAAGHGGQILVSSSTAELTGDTLPRDVTLVDLGEHQLRDLSRPDRILQLSHPGLRQDFPALRTAVRTTGNLPLPMSSFVGRTAERQSLRDALVRSRLVTLVGVGGVGKTSLAVRVAREVQSEFPDGAWLCELAPVRDPDDVVPAVAAVFGVAARQGMSLQQSLLAFLGEERALLVLDNCEHLIRAAADLAVEIVSSCPGMTVLATSREGLGVTGEVLQVVPPLDVPDPRDDPDAVTASTAVQLFADRASAQRGDFVIDDDNRADVAALCQRLDGVPLAIELAAARAAMMEPAELLERLDRRFRILAGGDRTGVERHQTMRAAVDWSFQLLDEDEQQLLTRLSVFAGGWTLDAAEAVCAGGPIDVDDVFDLLGRLVARSLVVVEPGSPTRYRLLETIRQYAEEHLGASEDIEHWRGRHRRHHLDALRTATEQLFGPRSEAVSAALARDFDNLRAAMASAIRAGDVGYAVTLLTTVPGVGRPGYEPGELLVLDPLPVVDLARSQGEPTPARLLAICGLRALVGGDIAAGVEWLAAAKRAPLPRDEREQRMGQYAIADLEAQLAQASGNMHAAIPSADEALALARAARSVEEEQAYLCVAAELRLGTDDPIAIEYAEEALASARRAGVTSCEVRALCILANAFAHQDPGHARELVAEAEALEPRNTMMLGGIAFAASAVAEWPIAFRTAVASLQLDRRSGSWAPFHLSGLFNFVARGLAEFDPEGASVLQGAARGAMRRMLTTTSDRAAPTLQPSADPDTDARNLYLDNVLLARREATELAVKALGEARWRELRAEGESLDRDRATAYTLSRIRQFEDQLAATSPVTDAEATPESDEIVLTDRQLEVAELVARGLSNKAIADRLHISAYTVETHVRNILERLDATGRAQIVGWWMARHE